MAKISDEKALDVHKTVGALKRMVGKGPHDWMHFTTVVSDVLAKLTAEDLERLGNAFCGADVALKAERVVEGDRFARGRATFDRLA